MTAAALLLAAALLAAGGSAGTRRRAGIRPGSTCCDMSELYQSRPSGRGSTPMMPTGSRWAETAMPDDAEGAEGVADRLSQRGVWG